MSNIVAISNIRLPATTAADADPFQTFADHECGGRHLKFTKGDWIADDELMNTKQVTVDVEQMLTGWRKWMDGKIVDIDLGRVADGHVPKMRRDLGDTDPANWPLDGKGDRSDPWQFCHIVRAVDDEGATFIWAATSEGAKRALGTLARSYASRRKRGQAGMPIVVLEADSYRHSKFGKVDIPVLRVLGWTGADPKKELEKELNDEVPF
jgi:hypothetical protein